MHIAILQAKHITSYYLCTIPILGNVMPYLRCPLPNLWQWLWKNYFTFEGVKVKTWIRFCNAEKSKIAPVKHKAKNYWLCLWNLYGRNACLSYGHGFCWLEFGSGAYEDLKKLWTTYIIRVVIIMPKCSFNLKKRWPANTIYAFSAKSNP